jgi:type I restriction enzyme M protein
VTIQWRQRRARADLVAYLDEQAETPYVVVQTKMSLRKELSLLDPAIQQAFTYAAALGETVRYLLITDGAIYKWFERAAHGSSLIRLDDPPAAPTEQPSAMHADSSTVAVTDPDDFARILSPVLDVMRRDGISGGLELGLQLDRLLIAKLYDEQEVAAQRRCRFALSDEPNETLSDRVEKLYMEALHQYDLVATNEERSLSPAATRQVVEILEPYALSSVTSSVRSRVFWDVFARFGRADEAVHTTSESVAELLVRLVAPLPDERVIDPACGTGLLLVEAQRYALAQTDSSYEVPPGEPWHGHVGVEKDRRMAAIAAANLVLAGLSGSSIVHADALDTQAMARASIRAGDFDVVLIDPPFGKVSDTDSGADSFLPVHPGRGTSLELLFLEFAVDLVAPGGRLAVLVPDSFLISPTLRNSRLWLLDQAFVSAIVSLPAGALSSSGNEIKASLLLLRKKGPRASDSPILIADVRDDGRNRQGRPAGADGMLRLIRLLDGRRPGSEWPDAQETDELRLWHVSASEISPDRLSVSVLDPARLEFSDLVRRGYYRTVRLDEIVNVISGRTVKGYVPRNNHAAMVIQAGAVRDLWLDLASVPYVPMDVYRSARGAHVQPGDVLITTTGQHLGRAAAVDSLERPAIASGAVTILRPLQTNIIDSSYLASVLNSELGRRQINLSQAPSPAQPYIRRSDLSAILVPLPGLDKQREIAQRVHRLRTEAEALHRRASVLESETRRLILSELLGTTDDE